MLNRQSSMLLVNAVHTMRRSAGPDIAVDFLREQIRILTVLAIQASIERAINSARGELKYLATRTGVGMVMDEDYVVAELDVMTSAFRRLVDDLLASIDQKQANERYPSNNNV